MSGHTTVSDAGAHPDTPGVIKIVLVTQQGEEKAIIAAFAFESEEVFRRSGSRFRALVVWLEILGVIVSLVQCALDPSIKVHQFCHVFVGLLPHPHLLS